MSNKNDSHAQDENGSAELLRHQRIEAAKDAIVRCPSFADMMSPPAACALDMATAAIDAASAIHSPAACVTQADIVAVISDSIGPGFLPEDTLEDMAHGVLQKFDVRPK